MSRTFDMYPLYGTSSVFDPSGSSTYTCCNAWASSSGVTSGREATCLSFESAALGIFAIRERNKRRVKKAMSRERRDFGLRPFSKEGLRRLIGMALGAGVITTFGGFLN